MNIPVVVAACISTLALVAHIFIGTKETAAIAPTDGNKKLELHWKQSMCAFQMLSVDLLLVTIVLFVIGLTDLVSIEPELTLLLSLVFLLWGIVWFIQLLWLKSKPVTYLVLAQWAVWLLCAGLLYWGA
ncbi:MAG: hypothetical protein V3U76_03835 [Granulosicoccus sp.]